MTKRFLALLLALIMCISLAACGGNSDGEEEKNEEKVEQADNDKENEAPENENKNEEENAPTFSEGLKYKLNDDGKSYTVVGYGTCTDKNVIIPAEYSGHPVTSIDGGLKDEWPTDGIESIIVPETVITLENFAFNRIQSLKSVTLPDSITTIGQGVFEDCSSLETVVIPKQVTVLNKDLFKGCTSLKEIVLQNPDTYLNGYNTFLDCSEDLFIKYVGELPILTPVTMDEQVIYNEHGITVTAKELIFEPTALGSEPKSYYKAQFVYEITNNSTSSVQFKHLSFDINGTAAANGYADDVVQLDSGESKSYTINFNGRNETNKDLKIIKEISMSFKFESCHEKTLSVDGGTWYTGEYIIDSVLAEDTGALIATTNYAEHYPELEQTDSVASN